MNCRSFWRFHQTNRGGKGDKWLNFPARTFLSAKNANGLNFLSKREEGQQLAANTKFFNEDKLTVLVVP